MASLLASIAKWIGEFAAQQAWAAITAKKAVPVAQLLNTIMVAQNKIAHQIENLSIKLEALEAMRRILYWSKRMDEIMADFKTLNGGVINEADPAYAGLLAALRNENRGVRYSTFSIYNAIMGPPGQGAGAIYVWHGQAFAKLKNDRNLDYFMADYVKAMDDSLGPIAYVLRQGLVLSLFTSFCRWQYPSSSISLHYPPWCAQLILPGFAFGTAQTDGERLRKECENRVNTIANTLHHTLYPPGLRFLKPIGDRPGDQYGNQWHRWQQKDKSNYFLVMHSFYIPCFGSDDKPMNDDKTEAWNFALQQNSQPLGAMRFLSAWDYRGNKRLRYSKMYQQGWNIDFSTSTNSDRSAILFKLIPLEESEAGKQPVFRFVPYLETSKSIVRNNSNTFSSLFIPVSPRR
ncbi:hypothetical protein MHUMG1_02322 [Metarhizium humberi]|uniref:Uncharacterized protein n=1 Tax=Metarhizium humberi TaxID=2596975 RepID=A0A9P8S9D0_9HYPO|nr:hypothetical protein MHUMG1_02322 [Metarhizium humberi]